MGAKKPIKDTFPQQTRGATYDTRGVCTIPLDIPGARFYRGATYVPEVGFGVVNNKSEAKESIEGTPTMPTGFVHSPLT